MSSTTSILGMCRTTSTATDLANSLTMHGANTAASLYSSSDYETSNRYQRFVVSAHGKCFRCGRQQFLTEWRCGCGTDDGARHAATSPRGGVSRDAPLHPRQRAHSEARGDSRAH